MSFQRLDEAKTPKKGVLASYQATFMQFNKVNENNRIYPTGIAKNKILTEKVQEALANNKLLGEINHPKERFDVDYEKVAINTTSLYYDEPTDTIKGTFDILDTPMGRILKTLVDYGTHISLSARAMGKTVNKRGVDEIQEDSYIFKTFDAVTDPGFSIATIDPEKDAINESLKNIYESCNDDEKLQVSPYLESIGMTKDFLYSNVTSQDNVENDNIDNQEEVSESKSDIDNLIKEYEDIISILKDQVEEKDAKLESMQSEYNDIIEIIQSSNEEQVQELENKINEYKDMTKVMTNNLALSESKIDELELKLDESNTNYNKLNRAFNKTLNALQSKVDNINSINEQYKEEIEEYSNQVDKNIDDYNNLLEEYKTLESKYKKLINEQEQDRAKLEESLVQQTSNDDITLVNVITESKNDVKQVDSLTESLLNKLNRK